MFPDVANGDVTATKQGGIQAASLAVTLGIALLGGLIVGMCPVLRSCSDNHSQHFQTGPFNETRKKIIMGID